MFFSVDVVGSTAFKARKKTRDPDETSDGEAPLGPPWTGVFTDFYRFHQLFSRDIEGAPALDEGLHPQLIKTIGDELMLAVQIKNRYDALKLVKRFALAMWSYTETDLKKHSLQLKGAAWIAGFPITNHKVPLDSAARLDFIGPSMDCGFRVSKYATPSKLMVTVDLALLLLHASGECQLYCDAFVPLKGILDNREYPLLWYPVQTSEQKLEELASILSGHKPADSKTLIAYCEQFITVAGSWLCRPYFQRKDEEVFWEMPAAHLEQYKRDAERKLRDEADGDDPKNPGEKLRLSELDLPPPRPRRVVYVSDRARPKSKPPGKPRKSLPKKR